MRDCNDDRVAALAHELKNPLAAVKALVQLVLRHEDDARARTRLDVVLAEVVRMEAMLRQPSTAATALDLGPVDLPALAGEVVAIVEARAVAAGVALTVTAGAVPAVIGDGARLKAAVLNLVGNAIEATPVGGRVELRVATSTDGIELDVIDDGAGIAADDLPRLGTPFFTRRRGGTGLGVTLARATIEQHGGSLEYRSQLGAGTRVRVRLPRVAASRHPGQESTTGCRSRPSPFV